MEEANRIIAIDIKLKDIEARAKNASEALKSFLRVGYKLLLSEKRRLINSAAKEGIATKLPLDISEQV
jgi:hypothetical protein